MANENSKLVYSTGSVIPRKKRAGKSRLPAIRQNPCNVTVRLERKGRGGKTVTVIEGLQMAQEERKAILRQLKTEIGTGGTFTDSALEIQGDHCGRIMGELQKMGFSPKRSGG